MTSEQLQFFLIVAKHMNFTAAAKELYVTQPAISQQIAMLEKELGTRLFARSTRTIRLTRSGELFLEDAKRLLDMEENTKKRLQLVNETEHLNLRIAYLLAPCQSFLPRVLLAFKQKYPQVKPELIRMDAKNLSLSMDKDLYDICISMSKDLSDHPAYAYKELLTDTFSLICSSEHSCANLSKIDFNKLASEQFILFDPENASFLYKQIQQFCRSIGFVPKMVTYRSSMDEILFEVEAGLGVTILPLRNKLFSPASVAYIPLSGNFTQLSMGIAWRYDTENPAIDWFLDELMQSKTTHPEWF